MAGRLISGSVDAAALISAFSRLEAQLAPVTDEAARVTANKIADGARARARWGATGRTREAITVDEADAGGYIVFVGPTFRGDGERRPENLPRWLEFGTIKMTARPFLFAAARLEEADHLRRVAEAVQRAIDVEGLGS